MWGLLHKLLSSGGRFLGWTPRGETQNRTNSMTVNYRGNVRARPPPYQRWDSTSPGAIRLTRTRQHSNVDFSAKGPLTAVLTATCNRSGTCSSRNGRLEQPNVRCEVREGPANTVRALARQTWTSAGW